MRIYSDRYIFGVLLKHILCSRTLFHCTVFNWKIFPSVSHLFHVYFSLFDQAEQIINGVLGLCSPEFDMPLSYGGFNEWPNQSAFRTLSTATYCGGKGFCYQEISGISVIFLNFWYNIIGYLLNFYIQFNFPLIVSLFSNLLGTSPCSTISTS